MKQQAAIDEIRRESELKIPDNLDITQIAGLSNECQEVLMEARPANVYRPLNPLYYAE